MRNFEQQRYVTCRRLRALNYPYCRGQCLAWTWSDGAKSLTLAYLAGHPLLIPVYYDPHRTPRLRGYSMRAGFIELPLAWPVVQGLRMEFICKYDDSRRVFGKKKKNKYSRPFHLVVYRLSHLIFLLSLQLCNAKSVVMLHKFAAVNLYEVHTVSENWVVRLHIRF